MGRINKKLFTKFSLKVLLLVGVLGSFGGVFNGSMAATNDSWIQTFIDLGAKYMDQYFSMVHFSVGGNDFGGGILWLPVSQAEKEPVEIVISGSNSKIYCASQVRGFYWNSQRGDSRIWPLDQKTHDWLTGNDTTGKYKGLVMTGGWYTTCSESSEGAQELINAMNGEITQATFSDSFGIYGSIGHYYSGASSEPMYLVAGVSYNSERNAMITGNDAKLTCSLQRLNNSYPFGYIYDDYGHMGLVGARVVTGAIQGANYTRAMSFHKGLSELMVTNSCDKSGGGSRTCCMNDVFSYDGENLQYIIGDKNNPNAGSGKKIPGFDCALGQSPTCLNNILSWQDGLAPASTTVFSLGIKGIVGLTDEITDSQKEYYENNQLQSTLLLRTDSSISNIVNTVSKNAEKLCRGKWTSEDFGETQTLSDLTCISGASSIYLKPSQLAGKTLVVKGASVRLNLDDSSYNSNSKPINMFIDKGNLFVSPSEISNTGNLKNFDSYGYLISSCPNGTGCVKANYLKGNFIVNGLLLAGSEGTELFKNRMYIHGKFISYNTLTLPTVNRKNTIENIVGEEYKEYTGVSLMKLFTWTCDVVEGIGSDGTRCAGEASSTNNDSQLVDKAFGLIDMNIDSILTSN